MPNQAITRTILTVAALSSFIAGIFLGEFIKTDPWWLGGLLLGFLVSYLLFREKLLRLIFLILIGLVVGFGYFRLWDNRARAVALPWGEVNFEGQIIGRPEFDELATYLVEYQGARLQVKTARFPAYQYGDTLKISGTLKRSDDYLFHQGIRGIIINPEAVEKIRGGGKLFTKGMYSLGSRLEGVLAKVWPEPEASFAAGLVFGSKSNIPASLMADFNRTGMTHIVAVSGYNLTIIVINIGILLGLLSRKLKFWGMLVVILGFVVMTGAVPSVLRAGLLAALVAWGQYEGRRINITLLLLLVGSIMLLFNPYALRYDLSFELSFLSFAGLVYLSAPLERWKILAFLPKTLRTILSETLAAQLMVLPILIYFFGRVSVISPLVNILVLWLVPYSMGLILIISAIGLIWLELARYLGLIGVWLLRYIIVVVEHFSHLSWASSELTIKAWWWIPLFYALIGFVAIKFRLKPPEVKANEEY